MNNTHKQAIMINAWRMARTASREFGGKPVEYIAETMKQAWALYKQQKAEYEAQLQTKENSVRVVKWFVNKNVEMKMYYNENNNEIIKETAKAILLNLTPGQPEFDQVKQWVPKSCLK